MLKALTMGRYVPGDSLLHRSDPRTKIALTLAFIAAVFLLRSCATLALLFLVTLALASRGGRPARQSLRSLKLILYLAFVAAAVNLATVKGVPVADLGLLRHISREAVALSATMVLRLLVLANAASLLTLTTTPFALADGLEWFLKPLRRTGLPVAELPMLFLIALRFLPTIAEEGERLITVQSARSEGFNRGNLLKRARSYLPLLVPLFASVVGKGDTMATALEARCYRGSAGRTRMRPLAFSGADLASVAALAAVLIAAAGVERL